jgi:Beta-lactamase
LNQQDTALLWTPEVVETPPEPLFGKYAYGFEVTEVNGHQIVGHTGGAPGIVNVVNIFIDLDYTAVILTNNDGDRNTVATLNDAIPKIITGQNP